MNRISDASIHMKPNSILKWLKRDYNLYLMLIPAFAGFTIFQYIPIFGGVFIGFVKYDIIQGVWGSEWVGFKYFLQFFNDIYFVRLLKNTLLLGLYSVLWGFPAPIILALMLNEIRIGRFKKIIQSISYLPYFISTVVVIGILYNLAGSDGVINSLLETLGLQKMNFIGSPDWFRTLYIGSGIWNTIGWYSIIYLAAMTGIDPMLYEAADIDGANPWRKMWHITLPGIKPAMVIILILSVGGIINIGFEKVYLMYSPGIYEVADVIQTYVYRRGIEGFDFSYAGAVSFFNSAISVLMVIGANYICRKLQDESLW